MGDRSAIEWTDATWNPTSGCHKVSQGCKNCYAERVFPRTYAKTGRHFTDVALHPKRLTQPLQWTRPRKIFVDSMSDLFHEAVPFDFIDSVFFVMSVTTRHTYQLLTKRPQRMLEYFASRANGDGAIWSFPDKITEKVHSDWLDWTPQRGRRGGYDNCGPAWPLVNLWLGVSVENQETAHERIPLLLRAPAAVRFLSCEPLLGPVDLAQIAELHGETADCCDDPSCTYCDGSGKRTEVGLHWVIAGGESGARARPMDEAWCTDLAEQCDSARVPFFMKQGSAANWPDFKNFDSFPAHLRVREFPR